MRIRAVKPKLIALDGDVETLEKIAEIATPFYQVIPTRDPRWATAWLAQYRDVSVFIAARELAGGDAMHLLHTAHTMRPDVLRVLMVSAVDPSQQLGSADGGPMDRVLEKPFNAQTLLDLICPDEADSRVTRHRALA